MYRMHRIHGHKCFFFCFGVIRPVLIHYLFCFVLLVFRFILLLFTATTYNLNESMTHLHEPHYIFQLPKATACGPVTTVWSHSLISVQGSDVHAKYSVVSMLCSSSSFLSVVVLAFGALCKQHILLLCAFFLRCQRLLWMRITYQCSPLCINSAFVHKL